MTSPKKNILQFDGSEMISDILSVMPDASDILLSHGLGCVGCHFNVYEKLEEGVLGHGFSEADFGRILQDLNEAAEDLEISPDALSEKNQKPDITPKAIEKINTFRVLEDMPHAGLKIDVLFPSDSDDVSFFLDFQDAPQDNDIMIEYQDIPLYMNAESLGYLKNCVIDFVEKENEQGFAITKKPEKKA